MIWFLCNLLLLELAGAAKQERTCSCRAFLTGPPDRGSHGPIQGPAAALRGPAACPGAGRDGAGRTQPRRGSVRAVRQACGCGGGGAHQRWVGGSHDGLGGWPPPPLCCRRRRLADPSAHPPAFSAGHCSNPACGDSVYHTSVRHGGGERCMLLGPMSPRPSDMLHRPHPLTARARRPQSGAT